MYLMKYLANFEIWKGNKDRPFCESAIERRHLLGFLKFYAFLYVPDGIGGFRE